MPLSPDGGVIADFTGQVGAPAQLAIWFGAVPGVVEHGLFPSGLVDSILIGRGSKVELQEIRPGV